MPVIKSAKKKLRQDKKRQQRNKVQKDYVKEILKKFRANPSEKLLIAAVKATDKAAKKHILPKNKAARSEEHTSELQSPDHLVCRLLLEKKKKTMKPTS